MNLLIVQPRFLFAQLVLAFLFSSVFAATIAAPQVTPGGTITAVNAKTGVVTAKVNSTGQVFTFTLANNALLGQVQAGQAIFVNLGRKQVSLDGKTASGTILILSPIGASLAPSIRGQSGSSASSGTGACHAAVQGVTVCSPVSGSTTSSPVQISAAGNAGIVSMRIFVDSNSTSAYMTNTASLNTALAMSTGSHNFLVRAWDSSGGVYEKSLSVTVNGGNSGGSGSGNSGSTNPQPVSYSCGSAPDQASDECGKTGSVATYVGTVTCGSLMTITGITPPASYSDWVQFQVTTPRANCASLVIQVAISSSPGNQARFDVLQNLYGSAVSISYGPCSNSVALGCTNGIGLGTNPSPLQPAPYYIRVYGVPSASPSTWTLRITG
jgi:hypothetical protein